MTIQIMKKAIAVELVAVGLAADDAADSSLSSSSYSSAAADHPTQADWS